MARHHTQWAAQFAVASELTKRGYDVGFTMGNTTPGADLIVRSPSNVPFLVEVKGLRKHNAWLVQEPEPNERLYYVLTQVPADKPNRFFVMTAEEVRVAVQAWKQASGYVEGSGKPVGFYWRVAIMHENRWDKLPI